MRIYKLSLSVVLSYILKKNQILYDRIHLKLTIYSLKREYQNNNRFRSSYNGSYYVCSKITSFVGIMNHLFSKNICKRTRTKIYETGFKGPIVDKIKFNNTKH